LEARILQSESGSTVPFTYEIDEDRDFLSIVASGRITTEEALATYDAIVAEPSFNPGMKILSDHRELETVLPIAFVRAWISRIEEAGKLFRGTRAALVESGTVRYGMARMASILTEPTSIEMRVFRDIDEARRWLDEPVRLF
jgi:hypothetical protein